MQKMSPDSPHIVVAVNGAGIVESQGMEPISFATGDAVVVPACVDEYTVRPQWELEIMRMSLPGAGLGAADRAAAIGQRALARTPATRMAVAACTIWSIPALLLALGMRVLCMDRVVQ